MKKRKENSSLKHRVFKFLCLMGVMLISLISCKTIEESSMLRKARWNKPIDLSRYCKDFDKIMIYHSGTYHYVDVPKELHGSKIYYFKEGSVVKVINLEDFQSEPFFTDVIRFYEPIRATIIRNRGDTLFYVRKIQEFRRGNVFILAPTKKEIIIEKCYR